VELTFQPDDGGSEVGLEHRNLERFRKQTATWTATVAEGWRRKLDDLPPSPICPTRRNEGRPGPHPPHSLQPHRRVPWARTIPRACVGHH